MGFGVLCFVFKVSGFGFWGLASAGRGSCSELSPSLACSTSIDTPPVCIRATLVGKSFTKIDCSSSCSRLLKPVCFLRAMLVGKSSTRNNCSANEHCLYPTSPDQLPSTLLPPAPQPPEQDQITFCDCQNPYCTPPDYGERQNKSRT